MEPGDGGGAITIRVIGVACDGKCLPNGWSALDQEGGITVIDEGDSECIGIDGFVESVCICLVKVCTN